MRSAAGERFYLCRNAITGDYRVVAVDRMSSLY
jgi:hypothetical protein